MALRENTDITVVGCINSDVVTFLPERPAEGETVLASKMEFNFGGKGSNQAVQAALLFHTDIPTEKVILECPFGGAIRKQQSDDSKRSTAAIPYTYSFADWKEPNEQAKVAIIGRVGRDSAGRCFLRHFSSLRIDCSGVSLDEENSTGAALITVSEGGSNSIVYVPAANAAIEPGVSLEESTSSLLRSSKIVMSDNGISGVISLECFRFAKKENPDVTTIYTAAPTANLNAELTCVTDYFVVNHIEAMDLLRVWGTSSDTDRQMSDLDVACTLGHVIKRTAEGYPGGHRAKGYVVVTNGSRPCVFYKDGDVIQVPVAQSVPKESVVDTTGAGDSFTGAFAFFLLMHSDSPACAIAKATFVAAESIKKMGSCNSYAGRRVLPPALFG